MTIITIAAAGIATVLLAVQLKGLKGEYAAYMVMAAGAFIFFYGTDGGHHLCGRICVRNLQGRRVRFPGKPD